MTPNEHVYVICCRPKLAGDVISGENGKTIEGYAVLTLKLLALAVSEILKKTFRDGGGGGGGHRR